MNKEVLGVMTVRGGSKGLPRKNVLPLCGKPLMVWAIEQAKASKHITRFIVSTEDEEMKQLALKNGVEVLDRPLELAQDETPTWEVLYDVLMTLEPYNPNAIVLLQATCPIRKPGLIDKCIEEFFKQDVDSLVTGDYFDETIWGRPIKRRQDIVKEQVFVNDGNVYVFKPDIIAKGDLVGKTYAYVFTSQEEHVDIDTEYDLWLAEKIMEERM